MTLRDKSSFEKLRAHGILDDVRLGIFQPLKSIMWALRTLGEMR